MATCRPAHFFKNWLWVTLLIAATLLLMMIAVHLQASRNGSNLWLIFCLSRNSPQELQQSSRAVSKLACHQSASEVAFNSTPLCQLADWWRIQETYLSDGQDSSGSLPRADAVLVENILGVHLHQSVRLLLSILVILAAANSIFTLVRYYSFAVYPTSCCGSLMCTLPMKLVNSSPEKHLQRIDTLRITIVSSLQGYTVSWRSYFGLSCNHAIRHCVRVKWPVLKVHTTYSLITITALGFSFAGGGLSAAETLHSPLLRAIIKAPIKYLDREPTGQYSWKPSDDYTFKTDEVQQILHAYSFSLTCHCVSML